ncbi:7847_t:CDS:2 [Paraglomus occultum]|uniref:7847_t:CDS:1 n=1 Tax=Paraglomus occultum TaxID=144539 RepID=A0A9N9CYS7_9GLOM|nr:7847_t:CDS:2 [Paraglomus occultum]
MSNLLLDLSNCWAQLFEDDDNYDVIIYAGDESTDAKEFKAHNLVLRARCSYFRSALSNDWARKEGGMFVFRKPNISGSVFAKILRYLYTGTIPLADQEGSEILKIVVAADELDLHTLINHIQTYLITEKTSWLDENPVEILELVFQHAACKSLRDYCLATICKKPSIIFSSPSFTSLDESMLILLLKRNDLGMEEAEIWDHLLQWGIAQNPGLSSDISTWGDEEWSLLEATLYQYVPLVRFFNIPSADFSRKVRPYKRILPKGLFEDLISHYLDPDKPVESTILPPRIPLFESVIIEPIFGSLLANWIDGIDDTAVQSRKIPYDFKLLLRGSVDGFSSSIFHEKCLMRGPTLIIANVSSQIIGGYNPLDWSLQQGYQYATQAFIFSLGDGKSFDNVRIGRVKDAENAVCCSEGNWPAFGAGPDLSIGDKMWSAKPVSYPSGIFEFDDSQVEDYEVFQVVGRFGNVSSASSFIE